MLKPDGILCVVIESGVGRYEDSLGRINYRYTTEAFKKSLGENFGVLEESDVPHSRTFENQPRKRWLQFFLRPLKAATGGAVVSDCLLCPSERFRLNREVGLPAASSILWSDRGVYVAPDLAPLVEGHLLIATTEHCLAAGSAPPLVRTALRQCRRRLAETFTRVFDSPTPFFEHGACTSRGGGSCIDHAHIHALPLSLPLDEWVQSMVGPAQSGTYDDVTHLLGPGQSYLFVERDMSPRHSIVVPVNAVPSQLLRHGVSVCTGDSDWRWQTMKSERVSKQRLVDTLARLLPAVDDLLSSSGGNE